MEVPFEVSGLPANQRRLRRKHPQLPAKEDFPRFMDPQEQKTSYRLVRLSGRQICTTLPTREYKTWFDFVDRDPLRECYVHQVN